MATPNINTIIEWVMREYPDLPRIQVTNCRPIAGTTVWSQHSWSNAADIFVSKAEGDVLAARLREEFGSHIKALLWQVKDHDDHIHLDTWPTGSGRPPCAGGTLQVRHKDGSMGSEFTDDIGGGDDMPLTNDEINLIARRVWEYLILDDVTGAQRGAAFFLEEARKDALKAANKPGGSGATADQIADELAQRLSS